MTLKHTEEVWGLSVLSNTGTITVSQKELNKIVLESVMAYVLQAISHSDRVKSFLTAFCGDGSLYDMENGLMVKAVKHFTGCNSRVFSHAITPLLRLGTLMPALSQIKILVLRLKWCRLSKFVARKYHLWKCVSIQQEA